MDGKNTDNLANGINPDNIIAYVKADSKVALQDLSNLDDNINKELRENVEKAINSIQDSLPANTLQANTTKEDFDKSSLVNIKEIVIFYTNDLHGRISTHDDTEKSIGIDKISKLVNLSLLRNKNTFWFDAGDFTHGTPRMTSIEDDVMANMLNASPLNAICTGNHDYNLSMNHLYDLSKYLNAYVLSANTLDKETGKSVLLPYVIYSIDLNGDDYHSIDGNSNDSKNDNIKLGVFGLSTPETAYKTNPNNVKDIVFGNPIEVGKEISSLLSKSCHIVIALTHLGLDDSSEYTSEKLAMNVPNIDLIIDGHSHTILPSGMEVNNVLITQAGSHGKYIGKTVIYVDVNKKTIVDIETELLNEEVVNEIINSADTYIENKLEKMDSETDEDMSRIVAFSKYQLSGDRELVRRKESELGNLVADALKWKTGSEIGIINGGTLRTGLPEGNITKKDLISIFPFNNFVQTAVIKGNTIREMLEHSVFSMPASFGGFMNVSGVTFTVDIHQPVGNKVSNVYINNEPLDKDRMYSIAAVDFIFSGGDDYSMLKNLYITGDYDSIENVVAEYINTVGIHEDMIKTGRITVKFPSTPK